MVTLCKKIAESAWFQNLIIFVIIAAGIIVGIQTYGEKVAHIAHILHGLDLLILALFTIEIIIKIIAEGNKPLNYFKDPWNVFDFIIVAGCFLAPFLGDNAIFLPILRLLRVLRVFRLVTTLPKLQMIVGAMLKSLPSMTYVGVLLLLLFYIYGVMAVFLFGENDPIHFGDLQSSMISMFGVVTLEGWNELFYINMRGCANHGYDGLEHLCTNSIASPISSVLFFFSFIMIGTMVVLNLFIGVIMNSMDEMNAEYELEKRVQASSKGEKIDVEGEIQVILSKLDALKDELNVLAHVYRDEKHNGK